MTRPAPALESRRRRRPRWLATGVVLLAILVLFVYDRQRGQADRAIVGQELSEIIRSDVRLGTPTADLTLDRIHAIPNDGGGWSLEVRDGDLLDGGGASHTAELRSEPDHRLRLLIRVYLRRGAAQPIEILGYLEPEAADTPTTAPDAAPPSPPAP